MSDGRKSEGFMGEKAYTHPDFAAKEAEGKEALAKLDAVVKWAEEVCPLPRPFFWTFTMAGTLLPNVYQSSDENGGGG